MRERLETVLDTALTVVASAGICLFGLVGMAAIIVASVINAVVGSVLAAAWKALPYLIAAAGIILLVRLLFF